MRQAFAAAASLFLLAVPSHAAGPLALMAKQIVQQVVQDFLQSQVADLVANPPDSCSAIPVAGPMAGSLDATAMQQLESALSSGGLDEASRAQLMQMMRAMQDAAPLPDADIDELVTRLEAFAKAMPGQALPCSPQELKLSLSRLGAMPMASGSLRMMLEQLRSLDRQFAEARATFARMSEAEQSEATELMMAQAASMSSEERDQLAGLLRADLLGLPPAMRALLLSRLKQ